MARAKGDRIRRDAVLEELRRVAAHFGGRRFSRREFDSVAELCKGSTVLKNFETWDDALRATGLSLRDHKADRRQISDQELLEELNRVWLDLGHRPSKAEWENASAKYSYTTYKTRFGGWINACAQLVSSEFEAPNNRGPTELNDEPEHSGAATHSQVPPQKSRSIPLKLRLRVLERDAFTCVLCGASPAIQRGVTLQLDHIIPFALGGETTFANLRTLCRECNLGKGADR